MSILIKELELGIDRIRLAIGGNFASVQSYGWIHVSSTKNDEIIWPSKYRWFRSLRNLSSVRKVCILMKPWKNTCENWDVLSFLTGAIGLNLQQWWNVSQKAVCILHLLSFVDFFQCFLTKMLRLYHTYWMNIGLFLPMFLDSTCSSMFGCKRAPEVRTSKNWTWDSVFGLFNRFVCFTNDTFTETHESTFVFSNNIFKNKPYTPPKSNMEPENGPLEKELHLHTTNFRVPAVSLRSPSAKVNGGFVLWFWGVWFCMNMKGRMDENYAFSGYTNWF